MPYAFQWRGLLPIFSDGRAHFPPVPMAWAPLSLGNSAALTYVLTKSDNRMPQPAASTPGKCIRSGTGNCRAG